MSIHWIFIGLQMMYKVWGRVLDMSKSGHACLSPFLKSGWPDTIRGHIVTGRRNHSLELVPPIARFENYSFPPNFKTDGCSWQKVDIMDECNGDVAHVFVESYLSLSKEKYSSDKAENHLTEPEAYIRISLIVISFLPLVTNSIALYTLKRPKVSQQSPSLQQHLQLLTVAEFLYSMSLIWYFLLDVVFTQLQCGHACLIIYFTVAVCTSCTQATRNWMVGAITVARCDVILRPLNSLGRQWITTRKLKIFLAWIMLLGLLYSSMERFFPGFFVICVIHLKNQTESNATYLQFPSKMTRVRTVLFLVYLRLVPIFIVIISNTAIVIKLLCSRQITTQSYQNSRSAAKTVVMLAAMFTACEGVGCMYYIFHSLLIFRVDPITAIVIRNIDMYLLIINSLSNFVAFLFCYKAFREELWSFLSSPFRDRLNLPSIKYVSSGPSLSTRRS